MKQIQLTYTFYNMANKSKIGLQNFKPEYRVKWIS